MGNTTEIEWADSTLNTAWGCTKVSAGCANCYMFRLSKMYGRTPDLFQPRKIKNIKRDIKKLGSHKVVFLNSMTDTFHEDAPDELLDKWFYILANTPHTYLTLTKRTQRMHDYFQTRTIPKNIWLGTSVENKKAYPRIDILRDIKTTNVKFVSLEPLLESVADVNLQGIQWAIVGGESDFTKPREFKEEWAREVLAQCRKYGTKFFYKQSGGRKKNNHIWGTNILDGRTYLEMPELLQTKQSTL